MSYRKVESSLRHGVWVTHYERFYRAALLSLEGLVAREQEIRHKENELSASGEDPQYVDYLLSKEVEELHVMSITAEIFCCMTIEAFLNFYGVVRLGEDFYKRNCERLGITEKLEILLATCEDILLPKGAEITRLLRKMFDKRNSLVHPKTKEIFPDNLEQHLSHSVDIVVEARERVEEMRRFFTFFGQYDNEVIPIMPVTSDADEA